MTAPTEAGTPAGWYHAQGDAPGTMRYWNGATWVGGPQVGGSQPPGGAPGMFTRPFDGVDIPELNLRLASRWARFFAWLIDGVIVGAISFAFVFTALVDSIERDSNGEIALGGLFGGGGGGYAVIIPLLLLGAAYEVVPVALWGRTVGKLALGIKIVGADGADPPGFLRATLRWSTALIALLPGVLGGLGSLIGFVSVIMIFADSRRRTINDHLAGTFVVEGR